MKKILLILLAITAFTCSYAQNIFPSTGFAGIGTDSPTSALHIIYNSTSGNGLLIKNSGNSSYLTLQVNGTVGSNIQSWANSTVLESVPAYNGGFVLSSFTGDINFQTNNRINRMTVTAAGNVGLGTTTPQAAFDVAKILNSGEMGTILGRLAEGNYVGAGTYLGVKGYDTQLTGNLTDVNNVKSFTIEHGFYGEINSSINFFRGAGRTGGSISFSTNNNTEKMRILNNGNVGIGTINPDAKLSVNGTIHSKEVKIDLTGWADYVFHPNFQLRPIAEIETYIHQNQHLPDMPSEEEVIQNGVNLSEMLKLQTKKIEELTLYMIEQDKQLKEQQAQNKYQQVEFERLKSDINQLIKKNK